MCVWQGEREYLQLAFSHRNTASENWGKNTGTVEFEIRIMKIKITVPLLCDLSLHLMIVQQVILIVKVNLVYTHLDYLHGVKENPGWYRKKSQTFCG